MFKKLLLISIMATGSFTAFAGNDFACKETGKNALITGLSGYLSCTLLSKAAKGTDGYLGSIEMLRRPSFAGGCLSGCLSAAALVYTVKEARKCMGMIKRVDE